MSIRRWLTDDLIVRKYRTVSGYRKRYQSTATVEGHIQPIDREYASRISGVIEATHIGILTLDVPFTPEDNDQIQNKTDNKIYIVKKVEKMTYGINQHYELQLAEFSPND